MFCSCEHCVLAREKGPTIFLENGVSCMKCGVPKLRRMNDGTDGEHWCRSCRYDSHYFEYFGNSETGECGYNCDKPCKDHKTQ